MLKTSPLSGIYRNHSVKLTEVSGWQIAENFGNQERESHHLHNDSVLSIGHTLGKYPFQEVMLQKQQKRFLRGHQSLNL